jgi:hypothetical protein
MARATLSTSVVWSARSVAGWRSGCGAALGAALGAADLSCRWDEQQVIISISPRCRIKNVQPRAIAGRASTMAMSPLRVVVAPCVTPEQMATSDLWIY